MKSPQDASYTRLIYPNGYTLELNGVQGHDQEGDAGFKDQVDNHPGRLFGWALSSSAITAGVQLSQPQQSSALLVPSSGQVATAAAHS
jgi:type IV secretory pathway VirB10-like protein